MMQRRPPGRLPLDLPTPRIRHRTSTYRGKYSERNEEIDKTASLLRKIFVSAIIIVLVLILKSIDTDFTNSVVGYVRDSITNDINIDDTLGKLKFVNSFLPDAIAVFGQQSGQTDELTEAGQEIRPFFGIPAEGKVVKKFSKDSPGIDIMGTKNDEVYAVAEGMVVATGDDSKGGKYIKINHENNTTTMYEGCSAITVNLGDEVSRGDKIGTMGKDPTGGYILHFESWIEGKPVDPLKLIEIVK